jgi:hypothetical protein
VWYLWLDTTRIRYKWPLALMKYASSHMTYLENLCTPLSPPFYSCLGNQSQVHRPKRYVQSNVTCCFLNCSSWRCFSSSSWRLRLAWTCNINNRCTSIQYTQHSACSHYQELTETEHVHRSILTIICSKHLLREVYETGYSCNDNSASHSEVRSSIPPKKRHLEYGFHAVPWVLPNYIVSSSDHITSSDRINEWRIGKEERGSGLI